MRGGRQTLQQGDHPSLNKQAVTPLPPTLSPLNNLDLLPSCLQATPLRLPRMSHSDRAFYADAAGEVGAGQGSRELQRPSCGKLPGPRGPVGRGGSALRPETFQERWGGGARLTGKVPDFLGTHRSQPSDLERLLAQAQPDSLAHWSFYPTSSTLSGLQRTSVLADGLNEERDTQTL